VQLVLLVDATMDVYSRQTTIEEQQQSEENGINPRTVLIRQKRYLRWKARRALRPPSCTWFERLLILNRYTQKHGSVERATCTW